jgi:branched-chain amino acid transport system ATP-binding protein
MLMIESLDVAIGSVRILRGVSLRVDDGQRVGLIGRNGAGKTTLMRTIVGALRPSAGSMIFDGRPLIGVPSHQRARMGIGYMPEDRRIVPQLTVEENVMLSSWAVGRDEREGLLRIFELIPELKAIRQRKGLQLSGGQQKLVALGRALMNGTKLLLLDEPFEGVAPALAKRLVEVVGRLRDAQQLCVVVAESDLSHSREMLDAVFTINRGAVGPAAT